MSNIKKLRAMMAANPPQPNKDPLFDAYYPPKVWANKLRSHGWPDEAIRFRATHLGYDLGNWR